jgi:FAD/FMN-containing dehydrogenase
MSSTTARSWGRYPDIAHERTIMLRDRHAALPTDAGSVLPYGNGRSYGDSCRNDHGSLLLTRGLDRFIAFDIDTGVLRCEAGVLFDQILDLVVPAGWFLPVTPGTRFVTVGGAIANDVHGKNHHRAGTFGRHVLRFELLRSDGSRLVCSPDRNADLFAATIGGLGLTGLVTWAEFQLERIASPWLSTESIRFGSLADFFALSRESMAFDHSVAWIDCLAPVGQRGRGILTRANVAAGASNGPSRPRARLRVPFTPPVPLVGGLGLRTFNRAWFHRPLRRHAISHYQPFFYPLDGIGDWNRLYGPRGFLQHQSVIPPAEATAALVEMLGAIAESGTGSFLVVLKNFGPLPSPGMMSFPREGTTLAMDFPWRGDTTARLLDRLDAIVASASGAVYPAKDARMSGAHFRRFFPRWREFSGHVDPGFSSSFWRRVMSDIE